MLTPHELADLAGKTLVGQDGAKIGKIRDVYEAASGPEGTFVTVTTGLFGTGASFVPLAQASLQGDSVAVPYDKDLVKHAPRVEVDQELTSQEEHRLYRHYGLDTGAGTTGTRAAGTTGTQGGAPGRHAGETAVPRGSGRQDVDGDGVFDDVQDTAVGRDTSGLTTDDAMTRSEERLDVGVARTEAGRARLRKRIVTEQVSQTVPVSTERARVVSEPITDADREQALDGPDLSEEEHEVVLHTDRPVVEKEVVPVERVRLDTDTVTEDVRVDETVQKEQIEVEPPTGSR